MIGIGMEKFERKIHSWINTNQRSAINCIRKRGEEESGRVSLARREGDDNSENPTSSLYSCRRN